MKSFESRNNVRRAGVAILLSTLALAACESATDKTTVSASSNEISTTTTLPETTTSTISVDQIQASETSKQTMQAAAQEVVTDIIAANQKQPNGSNNILSDSDGPGFVISLKVPEPAYAPASYELSAHFVGGSSSAPNPADVDRISVVLNNTSGLDTVSERRFEKYNDDGNWDVNISSGPTANPTEVFISYSSKQEYVLGQQGHMKFTEDDIYDVVNDFEQIIQKA